VRSHWKKGNLGFESGLLSRASARNVFGVLGAPSYYIVDEDGNVAWRAYGWHEDELRAAMLRPVDTIDGKERDGCVTSDR